MFDTTHTYVSRDSCTHVVWLIHMCDMAHSYVRHDSFICVTWLIDNVNQCTLAQLNFMRDVTHLHWYGVATVSRINKITGLFCRIASFSWGSFAKETYNLIDPTNCSHPITKQFIRVKWLIHTYTTMHTCDATYLHIHYNSHVWRDSFTYTLQFASVAWLIHIYTTLYTCDVTHSHIHYNSHVWRDWL